MAQRTSHRALRQQPSACLVARTRPRRRRQLDATRGRAVARRSPIVRRPIGRCISLPRGWQGLARSQPDGQYIGRGKAPARGRAPSAPDARQRVKAWAAPSRRWDDLMHKASGGRGLERAHVRGLLSDGWEAGTCPSTRPRIERCPLSVHGCIRAPMGRRRQHTRARRKGVAAGRGWRHPPCGHHVLLAHTFVTAVLAVERLERPLPARCL